MKVFLTILLSALLVSCGGGGGAARTAVRKKFPGAELTTLPNETKVFVVRTPDNEIWVANSAGASGENSFVYATLLLPSPTKDYVRSNIPLEFQGEPVEGH